MNDEVGQLFRLLQRLLDSCADHDVITDALVSPADPDAYCAALDAIRECCGRIRATGITREQLSDLISGMEQSSPLFPGGTIDPVEVIPLVLAEFSGTQEKLAFAACSEWGIAIDPAHPEETATMIRSALFPLSLADLLSPRVTRMQRFSAYLALEGGGAIPLPGTTPSFGADDCILIAPSEDPATFSGQIHPAVFRFLVWQGLIPEPFFPDLVLQALGDIGVIQGGGYGALDWVFPDEIPSVGGLFRAGQELFHESGPVTDVRTLFGVSFQTGAAGEGSDFAGMEQRSGHVLAGVITAAQDHAGITQILDFVQSAAGRPSGRAEPGPGPARDLEKGMQEIEQLLRAVTNDYSWRAVPLRPESCVFRPLVDLWPERHLILYDPAELAYRSSEAARALVIEAWYCQRFRLDMSGCDSPDDPWFPRLARILGIPRALRKGSLIHPGITCWMDRFCREEYSPVSLCADRSRISRLPLPDQFLEGALYEARTGAPAVHIRDEALLYALGVTYEARMEIQTATDEESARILRDRVWPVFRQVCLAPSVYGMAGPASPAGIGKGKGVPFSPRGTIARQDDSVQSPQLPSSDFTGRVITGEGDRVTGDGGLPVPLGSPGAPVQPREQSGNRPRVPGSSDAPVPGHGAEGPRDLSSGLSAAAGSMMDACTRSKDLLDSLASPSKGDGPLPGTLPAEPEEMASALAALSRKIDDLAGSLSQQLRMYRDACNVAPSEPDVPDQHCEELDGLLKVSEKVRKAAREYKRSADELGRQIRAGGSGNDSSGHLAGITRNVLEDLQEAGAEFQRLSADSSLFKEKRNRPAIRLPDAESEPASAMSLNRVGHLDPAFVADTVYTPDVWENFSYFDATFDETPAQEPDGPSTGRSPRAETAERKFDQAGQALSRDAEQYLSTLKQRTRSDWETMDERAERIRKIALFESHAVGRDDYSDYQRFYQPVAGLIMVTRKNIQQALQKSRAKRDLNELTSGEDIDEENLAAVRTTMRIFRDRGREPDKTRWALSLLIDASSSMHDETVAKKLQVALQVAILFGEAVNHIQGIRFEIAAFSDTEYIPLKRYQDEWNVHQGCYLIREVVRATGGTNDVGAVSSALDRMNRLTGGAGANRMIFVITDGQSGVGGRDQMRAILKTNKDTRIFGWGIGPDMEKVEETYLPYGTWVPAIAELPRSLGEVLRRELGRPAMAGWREGRAEATTKREEEPAGEGVCTN
jgi:hypothetical protein